MLLHCLHACRALLEGAAGGARPVTPARAAAGAAGMSAAFGAGVAQPGARP